MYRGHIATIPAGKGSFNANEDLSEIPYTDLIYAEGITYEGRILRKETGAALFNANAVAGTPVLFAATDFWPTPTVSRIVLAGGDGKLYKEVSGDLDSVTLKSGLSTSAPHGYFSIGGKEAAAMNRKLFFWNGVNAPQVLSGDGSTTTDLAFPPSDWASTNQPTFGIVHSFRNWAFGNANQPHMVYASGTENHEDFQCAEKVFYTIYPGVGERLVCGVESKGFLVLLKYPEGIFYLDDREVLQSSWQVRQVTDAVGAIDSPYAALNVLDDILFMSPDGGFHLLSGIGGDGKDVRRSDIADALYLKKWIQTNVNLNAQKQIRSRWFESKSQAIFQVAPAGQTTNNLRLVFDFSQYQTEQRIGFAYSFRDDGRSLFIKKDSNGIYHPHIGDEQGRVWILDQDTRSKGGSAFLGKYRTADTNFAWVDDKLASVRKNFQFLELVANPKGTCSLSMGVYYDGTLKETITFNTNQRRHIRRLHGSGYQLSLEASNNAVADFGIVAHRVFFTPDGGRP